AGVGGVDAAVHRAGVPVVDDRVELDAGIGAGPGRKTDLVPEVFGLDRLVGLGRAVFLGGFGLFRPPEDRPFAVGKQRFHEGVRDAHRVVRILPGHGDVGFGGPVRVVLVELDGGYALAGQFQHAFD